MNKIYFTLDNEEVYYDNDKPLFEQLPKVIEYIHSIEFNNIEAVIYDNRKRPVRWDYNADDMLIIYERVYLQQHTRKCKHYYTVIDKTV